MWRGFFVRIDLNGAVRFIDTSRGVASTGGGLDAGASGRLRFVFRS